MRKKIFVKVIAVIMSSVFLFSSCASSTLIQSNPNGAKLYMGGEYVGITPYNYSDTKIAGSKTPVRLVMEGYQEFNVVLNRNEKASAGAIIGGIFLLVPFLWTTEYKPMHTYELTPVNK